MSAFGLSHRFGYTGQEQDRETESYNYGRRHYDPNVGRFISEDPTGFNAGDANLYRYVGNNPVNFIDPFGLCATDNSSSIQGESEEAGYSTPSSVDGNDNGGESGFFGYFAPSAVDGDNNTSELPFLSGTMEVASSSVDGSDLGLGSDNFDFGDGTVIGIDSTGFEIAQVPGSSPYVPQTPVYPYVPPIFNPSDYNLEFEYYKQEAIKDFIDFSEYLLDSALDSTLQDWQIFEDWIINPITDFTKDLLGNDSKPGVTISIDNLPENNPWDIVDPSLFDPNNLNDNKDDFEIYLPGTQFIPPFFDPNQPSIFPSPDADPFSNSPEIEVFPIPIGDPLFKPYFESNKQQRQEEQRNQAIDEYLRNQYPGIEIRQNELEGQEGAGRQSDRIINGVNVEYKTLSPGATANTIKNRVNDSIKGDSQAQHILINVLGTGMSEAEAREGINKAIGISRGKLDSIKVVGDGFNITQPINGANTPYNIP